VYCILPVIGGRDVSNDVTQRAENVDNAEYQHHDDMWYVN